MGAAARGPEGGAMSAQPTPRPLGVLSPVALTCPEPGCDAPAEVLDRFALPSTGGPVVHLRTRCANHHVRTPRVQEER